MSPSCGSVLNERTEQTNELHLGQRNFKLFHKVPPIKSEVLALWNRTFYQFFFVFTNQNAFSIFLLRNQQVQNNTKSSENPNKFDQNRTIYRTSRKQLNQTLASHNSGWVWGCSARLQTSTVFMSMKRLKTGFWVKTGSRV